MSRCTKCGRKIKVVFSFDESHEPLCRSCEAERSGGLQACPPSAKGCADARAVEQPIADSSGRCAEPRSAPPELAEIIQQIEAEEQRITEMTREVGLPPTELDEETQRFWINERAWRRWAKRQPPSDVADAVLRISMLFHRHTEPWALLVHASEMIRGKKRGAGQCNGQRAGRHNNKLRDGATERRPSSPET